jgi:putative ABC transport system permease protein
VGIGELLRVALVALRAHKLRSALTTLGIVIAVWTIVSVLSVISGMNDYVRNKIFDLSPDVFVVTKFGIITSREQFLEAVKRKDITRRDVDALSRMCDDCSEIGMLIQSQKAVHAGNRRIADVPVNGASANVSKLQNADLEEGHFFTEAEDEHRAPVAVIGWEIRKELFPTVDPIGRTIWIGGMPHRVIGALEKQGSVLGQSRDVVVYVPLKDAELLVGRDSSLDLLVQAKGGVMGVSRAQDQVVEVFRRLRHTPFRSGDPIGIVTAEMVQQLWKQISASTFIFVVVLSGISLVVGAIVVANIMLVSVIERTKEIGLRLALGARKRDIRRQFLVEAASLALLGGILGTLGGALTAWVVRANTPMPTAIRPAVVIAALLTAGLTGILAGLFPARKAANLPPIEALRYE